MALPTSEREFWAKVLDQTIDDILPSLSDEVRAKVERFRQRVYDAIDVISKDAAKVCRFLLD